MTQKDKEILLKDLCARLPYGVKLHKTYEECDSLELCSLDIRNDKLVFYKYKGEVLTICETDDIERFGQIKYKPYLFPLSSITDEQEKELSKLGVTYLEYALHDDIRGLGIMVEDAYIFFEFCYKHHIDFLGLIQMGLAIDATGKNIY